MQPIRIGTWNVRYAAGADRNALRLARLRAAEVDVWVLTETHDDLSLAAMHTPVSTQQRETGRRGGRWTTIWTRWPVAERLQVADPHRTVAALLDTPRGPVAVYGTVLPWHSDRGPDPTAPAKNWVEQGRVLAVQTEDWRRIRERHPKTPLVIAGDFNMNLGGKHYYGTNAGRQKLRKALDGLQLAAATEAERVNGLRYPPIDHVVVPKEWLATSRVADAWEGGKLSDHSGLVVHVEVPA